MKQLDERALTVHLKISNWNGSKIDRSITKEVEEQHEASEAGWFSKQLIPKGKLKKINGVVTSLRKFHRDKSVPWLDGSIRLIPSSVYLEYVEGLNKLRGEFDDATREFLNEYPSHIENARMGLGTMFNINEYPTEAEIKEKFKTRVEFDEVTHSDFRVEGLSEDEREVLKKEAETNLNERLVNVVADLRERIKDSLVKMKERLTATREFKKKDGTIEVREGKLFDSVFDNISELVEILPKLNITR